MNKLVKITAITVTTAVIGLSTLSAVASWGERGEGCEHKGQRHAEKHGEYKGKRGKHGYSAHRDLNLTMDQAKTLVEAKLIMRGKTELKVGNATQKDDDTFLIDLVAADNTVVRQIEIDKSKGPRRGYGRHDD